MVLAYGNADVASVIVACEDGMDEIIQFSTNGWLFFVGVNWTLLPEVGFDLKLGAIRRDAIYEHMPPNPTSFCYVVLVSMH